MPDPNYMNQLKQLQAQAATSPSQWGGIGQAQWGGLLGGAQGITNAPYPPPAPVYDHNYVIRLQNYIIELQTGYLALHERYEELLKFKEWTQPGEQAKAATP